MRPMVTAWHFSGTSRYSRYLHLQDHISWWMTVTTSSSWSSQRLRAAPKKLTTAWSKRWMNFCSWRSYEQLFFGNRDTTAYDSQDETVTQWWSRILMRLFQILSSVEISYGKEIKRLTVNRLMTRFLAVNHGSWRIRFPEEERILKVTKKSGNRGRCRKLSLWKCSIPRLQACCPQESSTVMTIRWYDEPK